MAIYEKPVRLLMKDMVTAFALQPGQSFTRQEAIKWFKEKYPKIKTGTIRGSHAKGTARPDSDVLGGL